MNVLDPFEVADIEMWPLWELQSAALGVAAQRRNAAEYTVFQQVLSSSSFHAVLHEKDVAIAQVVELPASIKARIVPVDLFEVRRHPDIRIARRAGTIASLAKVISERDVSPGLRRTLVTQARRLELLAAHRFKDFANDPIEVDQGKH